MKYFISDTHFGHFNVINYANRPFLIENTFANENDHKRACVDKMNSYMIEKWNSVVTENDIVYFVGDFAFLNIEETAKILSQLKGKKVLIEGNHDRNKKQMIKAGFDEVHETLELYIKDKKVVLSHYPYVDMEFYDIAKKRPNVMIFKEKGENLEIPENMTYEEGRQFLKKALTRPVFTQVDGAKEYIQYLQRLISMHIGTRLVNEGEILLHGHTHNKSKRIANMINCCVEAWDYIPPSEDDVYDLILEYEKELSGETVGEDNFQEYRYQIYQAMERKLFKLKRFHNVSNMISFYEKMHFNQKGFLTEVPIGFNQVWYKVAVDKNCFIPKIKLKEKTFYVGNCRNATWAYFYQNKFLYIRSKFGNEFIEAIDLIEDNGDYDVFIPHEEYNITEDEKNSFLEMLNKERQ